MKKTEMAGLIVFTILVIWYLLLFVGIPGLTLGRASVASVYGLLGLLLVVALTLHLLKWKYAAYWSLVVLMAWGFLQFNANWKHLFITPPAERVISYNNHFNGTARIFPPSETTIIPDAYHLILGILIFLSLILLAARIVAQLSTVRKKRI